ncbi:MAG: phage tail protein I [Aeromonas veronii]
MSGRNDEMGWVKPPLLPYCSSELEKELDQALSHIESVEIPIRDLWNPWKCPLVALPYLAWALKVDYWQASWEEKVKRQVVASALDIHRIRGTRPAVEMALESVDVRCEIVEWFERPELGMKPGHFQVTAYVSTDDNSRVDPQFTEQIREVVNGAKPASRPFTLSVQGMMKTRLGNAATLRIVQARRFTFRS